MNLKTCLCVVACLFLISPMGIIAQVGIGQPSPQGALHITPVTQQAIIIDPAPSGTGELQFRDQSGSNYVGLRAPNTINNSISFTLPAADGNDGQVLSTDGNGNLNFTNSTGNGSGAPSQGADMFTQYMHLELDLWTPHIDNCDAATEVFVEIGSGKGFCIEINERPITSMEGAVKTCLDAGKRLPEPKEWKYACVSHSSSLSNMTNNWEWISNFNQIFIEVNYSLIASPIGGNGSCNHFNYADLGSETGSQIALPYRCVR